MTHSDLSQCRQRQIIPMSVALSLLVHLSLSYRSHSLEILLELSTVCGYDFVFCCSYDTNCNISCSTQGLYSVIINKKRLTMNKLSDE